MENILNSCRIHIIHLIDYMWKMDRTSMQWKLHGNFILNPHAIDRDYTQIASRIHTDLNCSFHNKTKIVEKYKISVWIKCAIGIDFL